MSIKLTSYIENLKEKVNKSIFSPSFLRLANLYYHNSQYEECINICNIGLKIYPNYYTAKLILLKALLKLEYISEAEPILTELEERYPDNEVLKNIRDKLNELKKYNKQEKIYYSNKINTSPDFRQYSSKILNLIQQDSAKINYEEIFDIMMNKNIDTIIDTSKYEEFKRRFSELKLDLNKIVKEKPDITTEIKKQTEPQTSFLSKIKIITETLADLLSKQGFFKEAFEAYNILLQSENVNKKRIQEKLNEMERNF
ncbi:MAG: hypothetical protein N2490_08170 [Ignavibacteria bacterium]|nr:hypothetical protein [Ignavibacteria bacterium]